MNAWLKSIVVVAAFFAAMLALGAAMLALGAVIVAVINLAPKWLMWAVFFAFVVFTVRVTVFKGE